VSIIDARNLPSGTELASDICIVGAGAAGLTLARELAAAGRDVCVVESGGFEPDAALQSLYDLESIGYPPRDNFMSRARYFGGSCNLWAGRSMLLCTSDLEQRDWVSGSGWPLAYAELAEYYPGAGEVLGLPGTLPEDFRQYAELMSASERQLFTASAATTARC
jgi:choline dehydrogenase-like flavoprotein